MNEEIKNKFLEFEELKLKIKEYTTKMTELKKELTEHVPEDEKVNCSYGVVELNSRPRWTYSEKTNEMSDELKDKKKDEEAKGIAINNPITFIEYRSFK